LAHDMLESRQGGGSIFLTPWKDYIKLFKGIVVWQMKFFGNILMQLLAVNG
jgi:hypothetical protein